MVAFLQRTTLNAIIHLPILCNWALSFSIFPSPYLTGFVSSRFWCQTSTINIQSFKSVVVQIDAKQVLRINPWYLFFFP